MGYTYLTADLRTNQIIGELPLTAVEFDTVLNGIGTFAGTLNLGDARVVNSDPLNVSLPARTALYVDRDGVLVWGGIIWYREKPLGGATVQTVIRAEEFGSYYLRKRRIQHDLNFSQVEQLEIARDLFRYASGAPMLVADGTPTFVIPGGDIGLTYGNEPASGILRDRSYAANENKPIWEALSQLGFVVDGFDFMIDVSWVGTVPTKTLRLGYPRLGRTVAKSGWLFELPGNMTDYSYPEDGYQIATNIALTGVGVDQTQISSSASDQALIDGGYPALSDFESTDLSVQANLDGRAKALIASRAKPLAMPTLVVRADRDPVLGSYDIGDDTRVRITDDRYPNTLDTYFRLVSIKVKPPDDTQAEEVQLMSGPIS